MTVPTFSTYDFPASDRAELFGDDMLLFLDWNGNMRFTTGACFRVPKAMTWDEFRSAFVGRWFSVDPEYDPTAPARWTLLDGDGERTIDPGGSDTLEQLGVTHKSTLLYDLAGGDRS
jgi:phenol hydroxylase P4 protein